MSDNLQLIKKYKNPFKLNSELNKSYCRLENKIKPRQRDRKSE